MSNPAKAKGDRAERDAVELLRALAPDLVADNARRALGAGRAEDTGDLLKVIPDSAIQVKNWPADFFRSLHTAAVGAERQAANAGVRFHTGLAKIPRARATSVAWAISTTHWPVQVSPDALFVTGQPSRAIPRIRDDACGIPRNRRLVLVRRSGKPDLYVAPVEAWLEAYRTAAGAHSWQALAAAF